MPVSLRLLCGGLVAALLVGAPCYYKAMCDRQVRGFHVVTAGKVYRSGQPSIAALGRIVRENAIKTVVCLREADTPLSRAEEDWAHGEGIRFVRLPPLGWGTIDGDVPAEKNIAAFRQVMDDPASYPVLIHCFAGIHRTGAFCAIYRMDYEGWTRGEALNEMQACGYTTLDGDADILAYFQKYQPRLATERTTSASRPQITSAP